MPAPDFVQLPLTLAQLESPTPTPPLSLILLIVGCALIVLCAGIWLYQRKMTRLDHPAGTHDLDRLRQTKGLEKDLAQLTREIEQLTQRFAAELDARTQKLEQLLAQADQRLEALAAEEGIRGKGKGVRGESPMSMTNDQFPMTKSEIKDDLPDDPLARAVYALADAGKQPQEIASNLKEHVGKIELILALREV